MDKRICSEVLELVNIQLTSSTDQAQLGTIVFDPSIYTDNLYGKVIDSHTAAFERKQRVREGLDQGIIPGLTHGWSFAIDRCPSGQEDGYIPAEQFTRYFSNRQIPIADADHKLREHDIGHVPSYQDMFSSEVFADFIQATATRALETPELCAAFTNAMDNFGDNMRNLDEENAMRDVRGARFNLKRLMIILGRGEAERPSFNPILDEQEQYAFDALWADLGLQYREAGAIDDRGGSRNEFIGFKPGPEITSVYTATHMGSLAALSYADRTIYPNE